MTLAVPQVAPVLGSSDEWVHLALFTHESPLGPTFLILPGATTDGASIPRPLWTLVGAPMRDGRVFAAAAVHDQLYKTLGVGGQFTRAECDRIFYQALRAGGVSWLKASVYYAGVRAGGWVGWRRYARDPDEVARQMELIQVLRL